MSRWNYFSARLTNSITLFTHKSSLGIGISSHAIKWLFPLKSPEIENQTNLKNGPFRILKLLVLLPETKIIFKILSVGTEKLKNKRGDNERAHLVHNCNLLQKKKTYTEQILEPSLVYKFHSIFKAHVKNMIIILFHAEH
jgi:hypothetical protein